MSDPTNEVLHALKSDLNRAVDHRQTLLEQLYATTLSFLEYKAPGVPHNGLASFLDANDITKGGSFDLSTLPGATILGFGPSRSSNQEQNEPESRELGLQTASGGLSAQNAGLNASSARPPAKSTRSSARFPKGQETAEWLGSEEPHAKAESEKLSRNSNHVSEAFFTTSKNEQSPEHAGGIGNAHPRAGVETRGDLSQYGTHDDSSSEPQGGTVAGGRSRITTAEIQNGSAGAHISDSRASLEDGNTNVGYHSSQDPKGSSMQAQMFNKKPVDAKQSDDLPSQFLHSSLDAENPMADIAGYPAQSMSDQAGYVDGSKNAVVAIEDQSAQALSGLRDQVVAGSHGEAIKDITFSRRPPMRIDTKITSASDQANVSTGTRNSTHASASQTATPGRQAQNATNAPSPPERMTTRISSGILRHKSVSELMGEAPKIIPSQADKASAEAHDESAIAQTPKSTTSFISPDPSAFKLRLNEIKERERNNKPSTVVFSRPQTTTSSRLPEASQNQVAAVKETPIKDRDYLLTLLVAQVYSPASTHRVDRHPLGALLKAAPKTLGTVDWYIEFNERQDTRILSKIHYLQDNNKWSLRQPERSVEAERPVTHWDVLLGQMKWMRTDFREEGKWKMAAARRLAHACAHWVNSSIEKRKLLQVKIKATDKTSRSRSNSASQTAATPELSNTMEDDMSDSVGEGMVSTAQGDPPAAIFSQPPDVFIFGLDKSPVSEKILQELPLYQPNADLQDGALHISNFLPDASWKAPIVPVSKYAQGKMVRYDEEPPRKKSRHHYSDNEIAEQYFGKALSPESEDVALFHPEHKHIRDRIHTGHAFRPPSEHIMPSQAFFECRQPSQWTLAEDDELRRLVREYAYNWSLISNCLSSHSMYSSGSERRTPWECFERWVTLEGLPTEMSKVNYFRAYHSRLQAAARSYEAQQQALIQQNPANAAHLSRRRSTQPYTVDRRKNNRHIHLIDAMRKQAKKRETKILKDQHTASTAALRKANEPQKTRQQMHTPQEFSRIKYERQLQQEERIKAARLNFVQQQKALAASRISQQSAAQANGSQGSRSMSQNAPNGTSPNLASAIPQLRGGLGDTSRPLPPMQRLMNGQVNGVVPGVSQGVPHAQMQPHVQMGLSQRMQPQIGSENIRIYQEATRVQAEQQAQLQRQRQQHHPQVNGHLNSSSAQNVNSLPPSNPNMLASMDGRSSPAMNGSQQQTGTSMSPRLNQPQALSSGMTPAVNQISNQIKLRNPQASPEQVSRATTEQLYRMSQAAMQAAAGNPNAANANAIGHSAAMAGLGSMANGNAAILNPQQYAQMMREQQRNQQRAGSAGSTNVNGSRSATPLNQRSGSAQSGRGLSQSPRAGQVGVAGGQ